MPKRAPYREKRTESRMLYKPPVSQMIGVPQITSAYIFESRLQQERIEEYGKLNRQIILEMIRP